MQKLTDIQQPNMPDRLLIDAAETNTMNASHGFNLLDITLLLAPLLALFLWLISLRTISLNDMNDLGLISALSPGLLLPSVFWW